MIRPATLAAIALGFLTAFVIGQLAHPAFESAVPGPRNAAADSAARIAVAKGFYDDLNRFLAAGDTIITSRLTDGFQDHAMDARIDRDQAAFIAELEGIRALAPALQLQIDEITVDDAMVAVALRDGAPAQLSLGGLSITPPQRTRAWEFLRIEGDRVAERWSQSDIWPRIRFAATAPIDVGSPQTLVPAIQRLILAPDAEFDLSAHFAVIVHVESGTMRASVDGHSLDGEKRAAEMPIVSGETRILDRVSARLRLVNAESVPAIVWAMSLSGVRPPVIGTMPRFITQVYGFEEETRVSLPVELPAGRMVLSVAWVTLPPGTVVDAHRPGTLETIAVLDGSLDCRLLSGYANATLAFGGLSPLAAVSTIAAGQGFGATSDGELEYRVAGSVPATLLVMTLSAPPNRT